MTTLVLISGSLRRGSVNSAAIRAAHRIAAAHPAVRDVRTLSLHGLPFYDGDVEAAGIPPAVRAAWELVSGADALVISTPAYNGSPPGVLKNALDWLSRPAGAGALDGTVVATMSASPGRLGALDAQQHLRAVLARCGSVLVEAGPLLAIGDAVRHCATGELAEPAALQGIHDLIAATAATVAATAAGARQVALR